MKALDIKKEKEVYDHIYHLAKSSKRKNYTVILFPPKCENCGYVFSIEIPNM
jgi:predicted Zn-ribbon and HTH transcriptional regulator